MIDSFLDLAKTLAKSDYALVYVVGFVTIGLVIVYGSIQLIRLALRK